jgi:hypothetical protein
MYLSRIVIEKLPMPEPTQSTTVPLLDHECLDLDERGIGEDIAWHRHTLVRTTDLPKEVAVGIAAGTIGSTLVLLAVIVSLILGLSIGLAGFGLGVEFVLQKCPKPTITSMAPEMPLCFDSKTDFYDLSVQGSNFFQTFDDDGELVANPIVSLIGTNTLTLNVTDIAQVNCSTFGLSGSHCGVMNTTCLHKSYFDLSGGYDSPKFRITNHQCRIPGTTSIVIHATQPSILSYDRFCITDDDDDPNYSPIVTITGQGFISPVSSITIDTIGTFNIISVDDCVPLNRRGFSVCKTLRFRPNGAIFQPYTKYAFWFVYNGGPSPCKSNTGMIWAPSYATVTDATDSEPDEFQSGDQRVAKLTGTNFLNRIDSVRPTFYLQEMTNPRAPLIPAVDVRVESATSARVSWNILGLTASDYYILTKNGACHQIQTGFGVSSDRFKNVTFSRQS